MKLQAEDVLGDIVSEFNQRFVDWQHAFGMGANFGFQYRKEDGFKEIFASQVVKIDEDRPKSEGDPRVRAAGERFAGLIGDEVSEVERADAGGPES